MQLPTAAQTDGAYRGSPNVEPGTERFSNDDDKVMVVLHAFRDVTGVKSVRELRSTLQVLR